MEKNDVLFPFQLSLITMIYIIGSAILFIPSILAANSRNDAWIAAIVGVILGVLLARFYLYLAGNFNEKTFFESIEDVFGKWIGKIIILHYWIFIIFLCSLIVRGLGDFLATQILKDTPIEVTIILLLLAIVYGCKHGIQIVGRSTEVFLPTLAFLYTLGVVLVLPITDFTKLLPILDAGVKPVVNGAFSIFNYPFSEMVILLLFIPLVSNPTKAKKSFLRGVLLGGIGLFLPVFFGISVLGPDILANQLYSTYTLAKKLEIPRVFERLEIIIAIIWLLTIYYKLLFCFYTLGKATKTLFNTQKTTYVYFPNVWILYGITFLIADTNVYFFRYNAEIWPVFAMSNGLFIPILYAIVKKIRKK